MNKLEKSEHYSAQVFDITDKELLPVARLVIASGIEILTEFTLHENGIAYSLETIFRHHKGEKEPDLGIYENLLKEYPQAQYVFINTAYAELELIEPKRLYGGLISFRAERGEENLFKVVENGSTNTEAPLAEPEPLTGERAKFATDILGLLKEFDSQSQVIAEGIENGSMTEAQQEFTFNFSDKLSTRFSKFFNYSIRTELGKEKIELESSKALTKPEPIRQSQKVNIDHLIMPKTEIFKNVIDFKGEEFDQNGIAQRQLEYKAGNEIVETNLMLKKPIEDNLEQILLFPIDTTLFKLRAMQQPPNMYDGKTFKAICTLIDFYIYNNPEVIREKIQKNEMLNIPITLSDIHKAMGYKTRLSKAEADRLRNSVLKLSTTQIGYDWSQERKARHIALQESKDIWGKAVMYSKDSLYMVEAEHSSNIAPKNSRKDENGNPIGVEGWIIKAIPPIYAHAKLTKVIASVPIEWFDIKALGKMTNRRNSLIQGITERISTAQYFKTQGKDPNEGNYNVIVLDSFFLESGIVVNNKQTRSELVKDLETILKDYKSKGLIKKYTYNYKAKGIHSIKFYL